MVVTHSQVTSVSSKYRMGFKIKEIVIMLRGRDGSRAAQKRVYRKRKKK